MAGAEGVDRLLCMLIAWRPLAMPTVPAFAALSIKQYTVLFYLTPDPLGFDSGIKLKKFILEDELLAVDYTKDVFGSFAYEFELSQKI